MKRSRPLHAVQQTSVEPSLPSSLTRGTSRSTALLIAHEAIWSAWQVSIQRRSAHLQGGCDDCERFPVFGNPTESVCDMTDADYFQWRSSRHAVFYERGGGATVRVPSLPPHLMVLRDGGARVRQRHVRERVPEGKIVRVDAIA